VAPEDTQFGFPEVKLGLLPGSLGTQRLPRLVGAELALDLISSGRGIDTKAALEFGIVDEVVTSPAEASALEFARKALAAGRPIRRLSEEHVPESQAGFFEAALAHAKSEHAAYPAAAAIVEAVAASALPFGEGEAIEKKLFETLRASRQSRALRHLFFAQREVAKIPGLTGDVKRLPLQSVGVLGGGTMGRGIAMNFLNAGIPTVLVEATQPALDAAISAIWDTYQGSIKKGRISAEEADERIAMLTGSVAHDALSGCDLVIEAVYEDMALKMQVCARLGAVCKPEAIIATNTSTLDVDLLAQATGRAGSVVGMHFFSPAHVMKLLEVVRGESTRPEVLATVMKLARRIGKVAVVSGVCYGFIGNRMAEVYMREAEFLIMEGAQPAEVDGAVEAFGMAMGPCRMLDMAGIDVGARTVIEYGKVGGLPPDPSYRALVRKLFELGRFGQKTGLGYYKYDGRKAVSDPETNDIASDLAKTHAIPRRTRIDAKEIVERLLFPMINEAAKILEEGIAYRPGDIDVVWTAGYGFPDHQGGPLFMADEIGLDAIVKGLAQYAGERGNAFGYWTPSSLLVDLAREGSRFTDWRPGT
jgi:3-hydroxyacyl-CoA dehydrogenase